MEENKYKVYLLLGANLGDREGTIQEAVIELIDRLLPDYLVAESLEDVANTSQVYESEPWGFDSSDKFLNQAFSCVTNYEPQQVLEICLEIEKELGREREEVEFNEKGERIYKSRVIDIDILLIEQWGEKGWNEIKVNTKNLVVPHAKLYEREFALKPLREIKRGI